MRPDGSRRIHAWPVILVGVILGLMGGLVYAWLINPVIFIEGGPDSLSKNEQDAYIFLVARSYAASNDWTLAEQRLDGLQDSDLQQSVKDLLDVFVREQRPLPAINDLAALARELGVEGAAVTLFAPQEQRRSSSFKARSA